ncbi:MAG: hypothetical protein WCG85_27015 [Polyangia bacterium]
MRLFNHTSTRVVGFALLTGLWAAACTPSKDNTTGNGGTTAKGGSASSSTSNPTGGTAATSSAQTGGATSSPMGGTTATSSAQTGGATSTGGTATAVGGAAGGSSSSSSAAGGSSGSGGAAGGSSSSSSAAGGNSGSGGATGGSSHSSGGAAGGSSSSGGAAGGSSSSGGAASGGTTSTGTTCPVVWDWEGTTADSWTTDADVTLAVSTTQEFTGTQSLKVTIPALTSAAAVGDAAATTVERGIYIAPPATSNMWPGAMITAHVWTPAGTTGVWVHLYMQSNNWANWTDATVGTLTPGAWATLTFTVPAATVLFPGGINQFGIQFGVSGGGTFAGGDIFVDSITVCGGTQTCSGTGTGSFDFETAGSTNGWAFKGDTTVTDTVVTQTTTQHYGTTGSGSLKVAMTAIPAAPATGGWTSRLVELANPQAYCGQTVTYHVMADNVTGLTVQPYVSANSWAWFAGNGVTLTAINTWTTVTFTLPTTINFLGLQAMGLQLSNASTTATYTGNVYIDAISWQ